MTRSTTIVLLGLGLSVACADGGPAGPAEDPGEGPAPSVAEDRYIVMLAPSARAEEVARSHGVQARTVYRNVFNGFAARIPPQAMRGLERNPHVQRIEPDAAVATTGVQDGATWGLDRVDQRGSTLDGKYGYTHTGAGVTVYVVDTGIRYSHQEFAGRAVPGFDVFGEDGADCHGHGTHVAGTVGSATYGVAKKVRLVSVRVLDCSGSGMISGLIEGLDWAAGQAARPAVINLSLVANGSAILNEAVRRTVAAGVTVVAAAGNNATDACGYSPGGAPEAITVGAMDPNGGRSVFSNYGSCLDIFAPGRFIRSTSYASDVAVTDMAGTSMAAPHVAGAAALVLEELPDAAPATVAAVIASRATRGVVAKSNTRNNDLLYTLASDGGSGGGGSNQAPNASFTYVCDMLACTFTDRSSDRDGQVVAWAWSFGDGSQSSLQHPARLYASDGTYSVALTVTDNTGARATVVQEVMVQTAPSPSADFDAACVRLTCTFVDRSIPASGSLVQWQWDFGDGGALTTSNAASAPSHSYAGPGTYQVTLRVTDASGGVADAVREVRTEWIALSASAQRTKGVNQIDLSWSGAEGSTVRVLLNGVLLAVVPNSGAYSFLPAWKGKTVSAWKVCEVGNDRCSAEVSLKL